jgi:hypothetical protein
MDTATASAVPRPICRSSTTKTTTRRQRPGASLDGIWPRAAALLARQAPEAAMAELWAAHRQAAGLSASTMRSQELCLTAYLDQAAHLVTQLHAASTAPAPPGH